MKLNLHGFPNDTVHASGFSEKDIGVLNMDVMAIFFCYSQLIQMMERVMLMMLADHGLNGTSSLSNINLPKLPQDAVNAQCLHT
jgi:hypothetical protein